MESVRNFSLTTFLLVLVCLACGFCAWNNAIELHTAKSEISSLRGQLGYLDVKDQTKLHVVSVSTAPPLYRWRVFVPETDPYHIVVLVDGVESLSDSDGALAVRGLQAGENMVSTTLGYDRGWCIWYGANDGSSTELVCMDAWKEVAKNDFVQCQHIAGSQTNTIDPQLTEVANGDLLLGQWRPVYDDEDLDSDTRLKNHSVQLWIKKRPSTK